MIMLSMVVRRNVARRRRDEQMRVAQRERDQRTRHCHREGSMEARRNAASVASRRTWGLAPIVPFVLPGQA